MSAVYEGIQGAQELLRRLQDPEEFETGDMAELKALLTHLGVFVVRTATTVDRHITSVEDLHEEGNVSTASALAIDYMRQFRDNLKEIFGKVEN